jgi:hypothetical protein
MKGVLPLLEIEIAAALDASGVAGVPVLPGQGDGTRPDEYVSVVATGGEHRGNAHLIDLEFRIVGPVFSAPAETLQERLGAVYEWAVSDDSPLKSYCSNGLHVFGHSPANLSSTVKDSQRAEILEFKVGAMASVDTPSS